MAMPSPFKSENNIPVVFACDDRFAPYTAVALAALLERSDTRFYYDLFILHGPGLSRENIRKLQSLTGHRSNAGLRFIDVSEAVQKWQGRLMIRENYTVSTYYRLLIPGLFAHYEKVIYLDGDILPRCDAKELFLWSFPAGTALAAATDAQPYCGAAAARGRFAAHARFLGLDNAFSYVNAGVLVWDLCALRRLRLDGEIFCAARRIHTPLFMDQDILNAALNGHITPLPQRYNFFPQEPDIRDGLYGAAYLQQRARAAQNPAFIHYAGFLKPWFYPDMPWGKQWWEAAEKTPFYPEIRLRLREYNLLMRRRLYLRPLFWILRWLLKIENRFCGETSSRTQKLWRLEERLAQARFWAQKYRKSQGI